ncbi:c-di-GMP-binding flagellar brake protein YcgR, contains PilZNR and PilZ domains [Terribacillus aidingensis]|uniref:C-di-GMP-binding flagellar brake protein YcgR, contains PilZNR and PilZ domains n=1 Tax=Terribacillus aidingensis TaxID=586416 RepID=A0A285NN91_9BACI|nr:PilZ domain-containing protein [Terribacillus aidingensis]SNZ10403.1 c-di-GMP-binding flagellar brake protein YcgR, contains PilZNR and PilZ domains [Terribacillus aidingensis]
MLKIGSTLVLEKMNETDREEWIRYRAKVIELKDGVIYIDYPINEQTKRTDIFPVGTFFKAMYVTEGESVFTFRTDLIGRAILTVPSLKLRMPKQEDVTKIQRRQYVRIQTSADVAMYDAQTDVPPISSVTVDISGGGLSLLLPEKHAFTEGMQVKLYIAYYLQKSGPGFLEATGSIVRIVKNERSGKNTASIEFLEIHERDRQAIIRFCFERQREQRKKGLRIR